MPRRGTHYFGPEQSQSLLDAIGKCRRECVRALAAAPIRSPAYPAVERVVNATDDLAHERTGNRAHLHALRTRRRTCGLPIGISPRHH